MIEKELAKSLKLDLRSTRSSTITVKEMKQHASKPTGEVWEGQRLRTKSLSQDDMTSEKKKESTSSVDKIDFPLGMETPKKKASITTNVTSLKHFLFKLLPSKSLFFFYANLFKRLQFEL